MNEKCSGKSQMIGFMLGDLAILFISFSVASSWSGTPLLASNPAVLPWAAVSLFFLFFLFDVYSSWNRKSAKKLVYTLSLAMAAFFFCFSVFYLASPMPEKSLGALVTAFILQTAGFMSSRMLCWELLRKNHGKKRLFIVSKNEETSKKITEKLLSQETAWFTVIGSSSSIAEKEAERIDAVLVDATVPQKEKEQILKQCRKWGKEMLVVPDLFELSVFSSVSQQIDDMLVFSIPPAKLSKASCAAKRTLDILASLVILLLTAPIMLGLFAVIPLTSKGPALYAQERTGRNGKVYQLFKFRSMVNDAEKRTGPVLATDQDPRITKIGRFIRLTRLDELPQIFNVLKGEMSLVGPRPERPFFIEQFVQENPDYVNRLAVKPGLTGLAQVMGNYTTTVEDKLRYDVLYIRNYSIWLDVKILLQTVRVILQPEQAAGLKTANANPKPAMQKRLSQSKAAGQ